MMGTCAKTVDSEKRRDMKSHGEFSGLVRVWMNMNVFRGEKFSRMLHTTLLLYKRLL